MERVAKRRATGDRRRGCGAEVVRLRRVSREVNSAFDMRVFDRTSVEFRFNAKLFAAGAARWGGIYAWMTSTLTSALKESQLAQDWFWPYWTGPYFQ